MLEQKINHIAALDENSLNPDDERKIRVMVADDSRLQRKIISSMVKRWGYEVVVAEDGLQALEMCRERLPDLILSDWMMPGMNGLEFCQNFRKISENAYGYFILLTSKSDKGEVATGLDAGADDFLSKPVNEHELRARITAGQRIVGMQRKLTKQNDLILETLEELQRLYDSLDSDLQEAKKLQQSLIPVRHRQFDKAELSLVLRQSGHVGGDLPGFFPAGEGKLGIYSIDVSGHGISSALMTARLAGYLSSSALDQNVALDQANDGTFVPKPPEVTIQYLNELVLNEMETEHYFTLALAIIDLKTGYVEMAQAGHPHPLIQRSNGEIVIDGPGGFPVGLVEGVDFQRFSFTLSPGDRLLILSDGVTECPDANDDLLGDDGLADIVQKITDLSGPPFLEALLWHLTEFAEGKAFPDDVSGVLFEFHG